MKRRRIRRNPPTKLDFSMAKAGDKYIGTIETPRPGVYDADVWEIVKRGRVFLIGTATNTGLLSDYYFKMEQGESEQEALEEINADLEVLATDGPSYMSRVKKIPSRKIEVSRQRAERRRNLRENSVFDRTDKTKTVVVFRAFREDGEVIALFPYELGNNNAGTMMSYMMVGQHGSADMMIVQGTRPATQSEFAPLARHLTQIGYNLKILKKIPSDASRVRFEMLRGIR